ncbi:MAG: hypothetical protein EXR54_05240 [Dehalococcoidia bacterium]|nr:hypothetical protein [Dehalococcoidia bacterium]MSQ16958.1 hypothetical protein [Dehalococcoidia bacterium]
MIAKALELLDESDEALDRELAEVRAKVQKGIEQLERGEYTVYTDETLHGLFDDVSRRGRERRASRNPAVPD